MFSMHLIFIKVWYSYSWIQITSFLIFYNHKYLICNKSIDLMIYLHRMKRTVVRELLLPSSGHQMI